jgi:hypothetical protein
MALVCDGLLYACQTWCRSLEIFLLISQVFDASLLGLASPQPNQVEFSRKR